MAVCPACGTGNAADARFCSACGSPLAVPEAVTEQRKVVTILFCDLVGSTALGESTDPEALRARMRHYFDDLRTIIERHGGTVEKFVGDAVMAVFGIPVSHEDDALRAVRAAVEMRAAISEHGLEARIGLNTGEVVVGGQGETLVTGDAVNVAARLEQAAGAGETFIGAKTRNLVRDAVRAEAVEPLTLKGKSGPVEAFRLLEVLPDAAGLARQAAAPLVGRERERARLRRDFEDAGAERTCRLFTLLGPAGIGKSRLVADFLEGAEGEADVLHGRCLPYGEDITYWPLVEILMRIGVEADTVIGSSSEETRLAFRRLLEARAADRPQIVVIDDLQWAEATLIDLVEHIADFSHDAPIFLLCVARTDLLDVRPGWGGGKMNASSILLEPLGHDDCDALIDNLLGATLLDDDARSRIAAASEGNPLFVEEMLAMVREHGGHGKIVVPPTIQALLQARLDQLGADERVVIERGSVEGQVFHRGSVAELAPEPLRPALGSHLSTLVRKELIRPDQATFPDDDAFRFRHLLIRDAAYESLPKATRAQLHEQFADWLVHHELVERDEILGYHLEQARRYRAELDADDPALAALSVRAAQHLAAAGRGALDRGDFNGGRGLLRRATAVLPPGDERRLALTPEFADALYESGEIDEAWAVLIEGRSASDPVTRALVAVLDSMWDVTATPSLGQEQRQAWRDDARRVFEGAGHDFGLALCWWSVANEAWLGCRAEETAAACEHALEHFERTGEAHRRYTGPIQGRLIASYVRSLVPVEEAIERVQAVRSSAHGPLAEAWRQNVLGRLYGMTGDLERARDLHRRGRLAYLDAGLIVGGTGMMMGAADIEWRSGNLPACEAMLRDALQTLEQLGDRGYQPTFALQLADVMHAQGNMQEVRVLCERARALTTADDVVNFILLDGLNAGLLAHDGRHEEAERHARRALDLAESTDFFHERSWVRLMLAGALALARRTSEAAEVAAEALAIREAKGDVAGAARDRERLMKLGIEVAR